jgi:orotidine-5'-phosphate decarboxylase
VDLSGPATSTAKGPRVIVALDLPDAEAALALASRLAPSRCRLKVGLELFTAAGPAVVMRLAERGFDVFLDLKYHDIPNPGARAGARAAALGVWMLNVHTLGGAAMLRAAREAVEGATRRPLLTGVTLLTSHGAAALGEVGLTADVGAEVERLATLARDAGLDGVVCAPTDAARLRARFGEGFLLVTPGIRPPGSPPDDQRRMLAPAEALAEGADYLVVGRPVTRAADPVAALDAIRREIGEE